MVECLTKLVAARIGLRSGSKHGMKGLKMCGEHIMIATIPKYHNFCLTSIILGRNNVTWITLIKKINLKLNSIIYLFMNISLIFCLVSSYAANCNAPDSMALAILGDVPANSSPTPSSFAIFVSLSM